MWGFVLLGAAATVVFTWRMFRGSSKRPVSEEPTKIEKESAAEEQDSPSGAAEQNGHREAELAKTLKERQRLEAKGFNEEHFNVAFVGSSGVGKSTMIDALRGLPPTHPNVRRTKESTPYPVPQIQFLVLWDMPGGGVHKHPAATYCHDQCLDLFKLVVLCFNESWTELCSSVAAYAHEKGRSLVLVYMCNENEAASDRQATAGAPTGLRRRVTEEVQSHLDRLKIPRKEDTRLFLVEPQSLRAHDGLELVGHLARCMAPHHPQKPSADKLSMIFRDSIAPTVKKARAEPVDL